MLSILHTQTLAHTLICMHTCHKEATAYILGTRATLTTCSPCITPGLKRQIWCFNSSISFSFSLFCKTVCFKTSCPWLIEALNSPGGKARCSRLSGARSFIDLASHSKNRLQKKKKKKKKAVVVLCKVKEKRTFIFVNESTKKWKWTQNYLSILILWFKRLRLTLWASSGFHFSLLSHFTLKLPGSGWCWRDSQQDFCTASHVQGNQVAL